MWWRGEDRGDRGEQHARIEITGQVGKVEAGWEPRLPAEEEQRERRQQDMELLRHLHAIEARKVACDDREPWQHPAYRVDELRAIRGAVHLMPEGREDGRDPATEHGTCHHEQTCGVWL